MFRLFKRKVQRKAKIERKTRETEISCSLNIDGNGQAQVDTGIGLLNHMLELFVFHGLFNLKLKVKGDLNVDLHHTNEDVGIVLGQAFKKALRDMQGITRFGFASVPMEDVQADVTVDISGRGHFRAIKPSFGLTEQVGEKENYTLADSSHFFESFAKQAGITLIIKAEGPARQDIHTALEPIFKSFGLALKQAVSIEPRRAGVPSTKGVID